MIIRYPWNVAALVAAVPMYRFNPRVRKRVQNFSEGRYQPLAKIVFDSDDYPLIGGYVTTSNPYALWDWRDIERDDLVKRISDIADTGIDDDAERLTEYDKAVARLQMYDDAHEQQAEYDKSGYEFQFQAYLPHVSALIQRAGAHENHSYPVHHPMKRVRDIGLKFWRFDWTGEGRIHGFDAVWRWDGECTVSFVEDPERANILHGLVEFDAGFLMGAKAFEEAQKRRG